MISVFGSFVGKEEIGNVVSCMESQWLGFGKTVDLFEKKYMEKFGMKNFAMVDSGSNALYMAIKLLDLPVGSEVIVPSFTWVSCAQAVVVAGCKPIFCDVDLDTMNVTVDDIEEKISKKTSAVMVVHYAGLPVDLYPIINIGLPVVEDAAHAINSIHKGNLCGTMGDVGIYSYDAVKNLTTGEGGGITGDRDMIDRAKILRYCGIGKSGFDSISDSRRWWEHNIQESFIKMLPTNIAASIGLAQLDKFDILQQRRKEIWDIYQEEFQNIPIIRPREAQDRDRHCYFTYCVRTAKRDDLARYLLGNDIYSTLRYHPLHLCPLYGQTNIDLPNSGLLGETALNIPLHPRMEDKDVFKVVETIKRFYR